MRRLALRLPTALQISDSYAILFHEDGVSEFTHLENHPNYRTLRFPPHKRSSRIWATIDPNPDLLEPAWIFRSPDAPFFVVDAVSGRFDHFGWLDKIAHESFYMKPWTFPEVIQAYMDFTPGGSQSSHPPQSPVPWWQPPHRAPALVLAQ
jgi:hypothetical protein